MAISNKDRVSRALDQLREGLTPFVESEFKSQLGDQWVDKLDDNREHPMRRTADGQVDWDTQALMTAMHSNWLRPSQTME